MIIQIVKNTWSIFLGLAILMLGNGLQGTLTGWRAIYEGFSPSTTGLVMAGYFIGFLLGSLITPSLVRGVGHIRVFAAFASLASAAVLIQILFISPPVWFGMRLLTGTCFAGAFVIVESWLNARSDDNSRGRVLSIYMIVTFIGMACGQFLLDIANPAEFNLFLVASILLSLALVPVLIGRINAPEIELHKKMGFFELISHAPTGSLSLFLVSIAQGALFGMAAVYASKAGFTVTETVWFMTSFILLGALLQWPIGWLSDLIDRRLTIAGTALINFVLCILLLTVELPIHAFIGLFGIIGAMSLVIYPLAVAITNDRLQPEQMVSASSTIALIFGCGSILGLSLSDTFWTTLVYPVFLSICA